MAFIMVFLMRMMQNMTDNDDYIVVGNMKCNKSMMFMATMNGSLNMEMVMEIANEIIE